MKYLDGIGVKNYLVVPQKEHKSSIDKRWPAKEGKISLQ